MTTSIVRTPIAPVQPAPASGATSSASPIATSSATASSLIPPPISGLAGPGGRGTRVEVQASLLALIGGLIEYYEPGDVFQLETATFTRDTLIDELQAFVACSEDTKAAHVAWQTCLQTERANQVTLAPILEGVKHIVQARFNKSSSKMARFGFSPFKKYTKTAESKLAAAVKARATREARGTRGSAQKKLITGAVTGVTITPVTGTR